jgi:hypothetical protein
MSMFGRSKKHVPAPVAYEVYGVGFIFEAGDRQTLARMVDVIPPVRREIEPHEDLPSLTLMESADGYVLTINGDEVARGELELVLESVETHSRNIVAFTSPDHVFVHAGVVSHRGRAIVIPGPSFSGKTTLVAALVRQGATYFSDEYAVIDADGLIHPFPKPLAIRMTDGSPDQTYHNVAQLGGIAGGEPVRLGLVVGAQYRSGADWVPTELSPAETILELFGNTYLAVDRPEQSLATLRLAVGEAIGLKGDRGEADATAQALLSRLETTLEALPDLS